MTEVPPRPEDRDARARAGNGPSSPAGSEERAVEESHASVEADEASEPARSKEVKVPEESKAPQEPKAPDELDIPAEPPPRGRGGEAAIPDRPMGVQADEEADQEESPGFPQGEPPVSG